jgi:hypothetical protein
MGHLNDYFNDCLLPYWAANIYLAASLVTSKTSYQSYVAVSLVIGHVTNLLLIDWSGQIYWPPSVV